MSAVLIVDDDPCYLQYMRTFSWVWGIEARFAASAEAALAWVEQEDFALVLTDVHMPDMNGAELARRLREKRPDLPVYGYTSGQVSAWRGDFERVFGKPIDFGQFALVVGAQSLRRGAAAERV